jgi:hypothetical protein
VVARAIGRGMQTNATFNCLRSGGDDGVPVVADVDKFEVRCVVGISDPVRGGEIA